MVITSFPTTTTTCSCIGGAILFIHHVIGVGVMGGAETEAGPRGKEPASSGGSGGWGVGMVGGGRSLLTATKLG
jgi:hypothetical protein